MRSANTLTVSEPTATGRYIIQQLNNMMTASLVCNGHVITSETTKPRPMHASLYQCDRHPSKCTKQVHRIIVTWYKRGRQSVGGELATSRQRWLHASTIPTGLGKGRNAESAPR